MQPRHRHALLALLGLLACKFDATGLGAESGGPGSTGAAPGTSEGTAALATTTSGPPPVDTSSGDPTAGSASAGGESSSSQGDDATTSPPASCGDGQVDAGEACDDGADNGPTRPCTAACQANVCGDGFPLTPGEDCDDGNDDETDACLADCTLPPTCGTKALDRGEACDDGNDVDTDACIACKKASCGDGFVQANVESCDGGGETAACNADCSVVQCGDSKLNASAGEVCDLGAKNGVYDSGCAKDCKGAGAFCGDDVVDSPDEKCEPGAPPPFATCAADCLSMTCMDGRGNCDGMFANGCEKDLKSDEDNCGQCGKECQVFDCNGGECKP